LKEETRKIDEQVLHRRCNCK